MSAEKHGQIVSSSEVKLDKNELLKQINKMVDDYNKEFCKLENDQRLIVETHNFFCRCGTCWYKYDGPSRDTKYGVRGYAPVYYSPDD